MELTFAPKGKLQIDDARICYRNFSGEASQFNREGDRNFSLVIEDEALAEELKAQGWNVKIKPPRNEGDAPFMHLPIKVKFNDYGPRVFLKVGNSPRRPLDEDTVGILDRINILRVDLDIRPFDWDVNGKTGRTAYLEAIQVVQEIDRFASEEDFIQGEDETELPW